MTEYYEQPLPIRTYDIDFAGIVSNIVFIRWLEDLRLGLLDQVYPLTQALAEQTGWSDGCEWRRCAACAGVLLRNSSSAVSFRPKPSRKGYSCVCRRAGRSRSPNPYGNGTADDGGRLADDAGPRRS
jgi:hypothetical protein